jgi:hypothetical protein
METARTRPLLALAVLTLSLAVPPARAASDLDNINALAQAQFRLLSEDLGAALSYKPLIPAEPLGTTGFDLGVEVTTVTLENTAVFDIAMTGDSPDTLFIPKVHVHKGLPLGIDVGVFLAGVPDSNVRLWGAEVRYAILKGGTTSPALALRGSYSQLAGVDQLEFSTTGVDLSLSKGFAFATPYVGGGAVWVRSTPDIPGTALQEEEFSVGKYFVGVNLNFAVINIAVEADKTGDTASYGLKLGWRF